VEGAIVDRVAKEFARSGSRRRVVQALVVGAGSALVMRVSGVAERGIKPIRCFKRGQECLVDGPTPCCGQLACNPTSEPLEFRCQKVGRIKPG
jgi:hypothetical protein